MSNLDASSPQLQAVKNLFDLITSLNPDKLETVFSKNYQYEAFNGVTDSLAKMDRETHAELGRVVLEGATKLGITYHEVIEAPGKVILHLTASSQAASRATLTYDTLFIISVGEEDGEFKITGMKDFPDPQKRDAFMGSAIKAVVGRRSASQIDKNVRV